MIILGIETSCDDTSCALLKKESDFKIIANVISSQVNVHRPYKGVFPALAKREHEKNLTLVLKKTLKKANLLKKKNNKIPEEKLKKILIKNPELLKNLIVFLKNYQKPKISAIAVTEGPGLEPCLWTGINFAKALSFVWRMPIIPVNHLKAHILINFLNNKKISFPALALIVSGGHTQLVLMKNIKSFKLLGETRDDAAGECFDKIARLLKLEYPGGPEIAKRAELIKETKVSLPRPMIYANNYEFSFSGLKTAVLHEVSNKKLNKNYVNQVAKESQQAIIDVLIKKTIKAAKDFKVKSIILGGGVTANKELKKQIKKKSHLPVFCPPNNLSTDNALMVCLTAFYNKKTKNWQNLKANANLKIYG